MLASSDQVSVNAATTFFNSQSPMVKGVGPITLGVTAADNGLTRTVTVNYQTTSSALFGGYTGKSSLPLSGSSQSSATVPPNIDFYLLLDNSPSMAIAATTSGINTMVANTPDQCAFGCHEADTSPNDYYGLARSLGVTLRMDLLAQAVQNLMGTAQSTATSNNANYRAAIYTFNIGFNTITALTSSLGTAQAQAANIQLYEVPYQNWSSDAITNYTNAMTQINSIMPNPGGGTRTAGDTPQEVLFIVTDGVEDEMVNGSRVQSLMSTSYCTTDQEPRHPHRRALHDLSAAADQLLVQQLHQAVSAQHRLEPAELRVARPLFPGVDRPGHLGRAGAALQYRGGDRASHEISRSRSLLIGAFAALGVGEFFPFSTRAALVLIGKSDTKLVVRPPHHSAGPSLSIGRPKPKLVRDSVCPHAGELCAAGG